MLVRSLNSRRSSMAKPVSDLSELIRDLSPVHVPGEYAFVSVNSYADLRSAKALATVWEHEGLSAVLELGEAQALGVEILFEAAWITLEVNSALDAVGLTGAFANALAEAGLSCNVVAGAMHDHLFVPLNDVERALDVLRALSSGTSAQRY